MRMTLKSIHIAAADLLLLADHDANARSEMDLFSQHRATKEEPQALYAGQVLQPKEITVGHVDDK